MAKLPDPNEPGAAEIWAHMMGVRPMYLPFLREYIRRVVSNEAGA